MMNLRFLALAFLILFSNNAQAAEHPWQLRTKDEGISVYTRKVDGSTMLEFKATATVDAPLLKLIPIFEDAQQMPHWYYQCVSSAILDNGATGQDPTIYIVLHLPWPVTARDAVFKRIKTVDAASGVVSYSIQAFPDKIPAAKGKIRVLAINSVWHLTPLANGKTEIYFQQHSNPGGSIPAFLVNELVVDIPFHSLKNIRELVKK